MKKFYIGSARTAAELADLYEAIPDDKMPDIQFKAALEQTKENVQRLLKEQESIVSVPGKKGDGISEMTDEELLNFLGGD